jgi:hypothetical protein
MYLYKTIIYQDLSSVIGLSESDVAANTAALADFESEGKKDEAISITSLEILETTMIIDHVYADFADLITGDVTWNKVNYTDDGYSYQLFLFSEVIL